MGIRFETTLICDNCGDESLKSESEYSTYKVDTFDEQWGNVDGLWLHACRDCADELEIRRGKISNLDRFVYNRTTEELVGSVTRASMDDEVTRTLVEDMEEDSTLYRAAKFVEQTVNEQRS